MSGFGGKGGATVDVGGAFASGKGRAPSKELVERLSRRPERGDAAARKEGREGVFVQAAGKPAAGERAAMKVNAVTGKMTAVEKRADTGDMVKEGSLYIPKEYLTAAAAAGLGGQNGMYAHLAGVKRTLGSAHNMAPSAQGPGAGQQQKAYVPKVTRAGGVHKIDTSGGSHKPSSTNVGGRVHKIDTGPKPGSNIKHVVQGRARTIRSGEGAGAGSGANESSYTRGKGVINNFGGCFNTGARSNNAAAKQPEETNVVPAKDRKTGIASFGSCGGRSFIKQDKPDKAKLGAAKAAAAAAASAAHQPPAKPRRESITAQLGGAKQTQGVDMSDREKRAAYFAQKFGAAAVAQQ
jgi:hypothetical protein